MTDAYLALQTCCFPVLRVLTKGLLPRLADGASWCLHITLRSFLGPEASWMIHSPPLAAPVPGPLWLGLWLSLLHPPVLGGCSASLPCLHLLLSLVCRSDSSSGQGFTRPFLVWPGQLGGTPQREPQQVPARPGPCLCTWTSTAPCSLDSSAPLGGLRPPGPASCAASQAPLSEVPLSPSSAGLPCHSLQYLAENLALRKPPPI